MNLRRSIAALLLAGTAAAAGFGAYWGWQRQQPQLAPDLALTALDGAPHRLSEFRGKLLLVNFWASWCAPCIQEIPLLVKAQRDYGGRGLQIIGPAMDAAPAVREAVQRFGMPYPIFVGDDEVAAAMDALGDELGALPYSVLIAPDGRVLERIAGGLSAERLRRLIEQHLPGA